MASITVAEFNGYQKTHGAVAANQRLFAWLSDDKKRAELLNSMACCKAPLFFTSHASRPDHASNRGSDYDWVDGPRQYEQKAVLLAHPDHVEQVLTDQNNKFSNSPYQGLGGYFMLALDDHGQHDKQRLFALNLLMEGIIEAQYDALATLAFKAGALVALKSHEFDLAAMAENIAARYVLGIFGFAQKDLGLILDSTRKIGRGLQYQIMGRHFVFEPTTMIESRSGLGQLAQRATEIISLHSLSQNDALTRTQQEEMEEINHDLERIQKYSFRPADGEDDNSLAAFTPLLKTMAKLKLVDKIYAEFTPSEMGLIAASLVGGSVTNIQNSICIALAEIFKVKEPEKLRKIRNQAIQERAFNPDAKWRPGDSKITDLVKEALRITPPVVFIPRRALEDVTISNEHTIKKGTLVLVALAGASKHAPSANSTDLRIDDWLKNLNYVKTQINAVDSESNKGCPFSKTLGGAPLHSSNEGERSTFMHSCPGMMMAMYLISYCVRQLLVLPSLAQCMNPDTGEPYGLEKRWGFQCTRYLLSYQKDALLAQTPLQTVLPIKAPAALHSRELRQVLALGAPFIDKVLADSKMVHFASFLFVDDDSKLILFTMYDGDFDTYIAHFAREFGHLFDRFFSHVAIQPKMPIRQHPYEFVQYLKQFVQQPVEGYYFSAYPESRTSKIVQTFDRERYFDFDRIRER